MDGQTPTPAQTQPTKRYTRATAADAPAKKSSGQKPTPSGRRRSDGTRATHTGASAKNPRVIDAPKHPKASGRLRNEILLPLAVGAFACFAGLGIVAGIMHEIGAPLVPALVAGGVVLIGALVAYVAWIVEGAALKPLERVKDALQEMEDGNYDARLIPDGALELCELAQGFNRMVTIVGHQRERLEQLAATDGLTGLANHRHFHERLRAEMHEAEDERMPLAVAAIDIDGFKRLNDERGHAHADEALKLVAAALEKAVRGSDLVARVGGDDFALILKGADAGFAREVTERAREAVERALPDDLKMSATAGFVCYPDNADEDSDLSELAGAALDLAKRAGGAQTKKYDPEQVAAIPTIKQQREEIDKLLESTRPISSVFQPLVDLNTGRVVGYEALSRFNTPIVRSPDVWFNQAQRCGRGLQLEALALKTAMSAPNRPRGSYLSLNFSPSAIASARMVTMLPDDLSDVVIEITEHELAAEDGALEEGLARLRARGAKIAVDDAGSGYAGLNQIMRVQPEIIKLDRSLVEGVNADGAKAALIEFFVLFASRVGARVLAEGIETVDELRTLVNLGVAYGQGYLLGRPLDPWIQIPAEITRALGTGALRMHGTPPPRVGAGPQTAVPPAQGVSTFGVPREKIYGRSPMDSVPAGPAGPVNRRLGRR